MLLAIQTNPKQAKFYYFSFAVDSLAKFGKPTTKLLQHHYNRHKPIAFWVYSIEKAFENTPLVAQIKKEKLISGSLRGDFWQPIISPEARKERSCQSFSTSHIGPRERADCPFHRPAYFRPECVLQWQPLLDDFEMYVKKM